MDEHVSLLTVCYETMILCQTSIFYLNLSHDIHGRKQTEVPLQIRCMIRGNLNHLMESSDRSSLHWVSAVLVGSCVYAGVDQVKFDPSHQVFGHARYVSQSITTPYA